MTKRLRIVAVLMLALIFLLTACKGSSGQPSTPANTGSTGTSSSGTTSSGSASSGAATTEKSNFNPTGYPIVNEKVSFRILTTFTPGNPADFNELDVVKKAEDITNVHIEWILVPTDGYQEKRNLMLASGDYPDMLGVNVPVDELIRYGSQGIFIPMQDLLEEYAPNITALYDEIPGFKKFLTAPDGNIYGVARVNAGPWMVTNGVGAINIKWLEVLGLEMPKTVDEFYEVMKAFKTRDPNGNGQADEIPFSFATRPTVTEGLTYFFGCFGVPLAAHYLDARDGEVISVATLPEFKECVSFLAKMYADGLIDIDYASQTAQRLDAKINDPAVLIGYRQLWDINDLIADPNVKAQYDYMPLLKGPGGREPVFCKVPFAGIVRGAGVITSACKMPEALVRYLDYYYDPINAIELNEGPIGVRVFQKEDGTYYVAPPPEGKSASEWRFANAPTTVPLNLSENTYRNIFKLPTTDWKVNFMDNECMQYADNEPFMPVMYTLEESEKLATIQTDLIDYINRKVMEWIGNNKVDAEWDSYLQELKKIGLDEYIRINQDAYNRFIAD